MAKILNVNQKGERSDRSLGADWVKWCMRVHACGALRRIQCCECGQWRIVGYDVLLAMATDAQWTCAGLRCDTPETALLSKEEGFSVHATCAAVVCWTAGLTGRAITAIGAHEGLEAKGFVPADRRSRPAARRRQRERLLAGAAI